jgi:3-oxoacyl-[acyl-carrier protein] reductase
VIDAMEVGTIAGFVGAGKERFAQPDIGVTNSSEPPSKVCRDTKVEDWKSAVDQMPMGTVEFARETLPRNGRSNWERLFKITSSALKQPVDGLLLSNFLRSAVAGLARTIANEYAGLGILPNNVCRCG